MTIPEKAVAWAVGIANDSAHGYDQGNRWGPDYDCSSLVISAYKQAGVPLSCTYTGNMRSNMLDNGFIIPVNNVDLATGAGLQPGDVLLNVQHHAAMYIGNGQIVQASGNEWGGVTGGMSGDQTGSEINIRSYYNFPWDFCLRYVRKEDADPPVAVPGDTSVYKVQRGDSLWSIAERFYGNGSLYTRIKEANHLIDNIIYPGQALLIPGEGASENKSITISVKVETYQLLQIMADGWKKTIGEVVDQLVADAQ